MKSKKQRMDDQAERLRQYAVDGLSNREIMDREGFNDIVYTGTTKMKPFRSSHPACPDNYVTYGLDDESRLLRSRLAWHMNGLIDEYGADELGSLLGISNTKKASTKNGPATHNWTLAQLQRLAKLLNLTFDQLLEDATQDYRCDKAWSKKECIKWS